MIIHKLAWRNMIGAGLRTWLSVIVLSMSYVIIIWQNGILDGWNQQALKDMIEWEISSGHYWHREYDPYDPLSLQNSHAVIPEALSSEDSAAVVPILIIQASIYPHQRMQNVVIKGIPVSQTLLKLPTQSLKQEFPEIPVLIGTRMAKATGLKVDDVFIIRWRDANGAFDATEGRVAKIMKTDVQSVDQGQIWIPLQRLQQMTQLHNQATIMVMRDKPSLQAQFDDWQFKTRDFLCQDHTDMIKMKKFSGSIMYAILLSLALLAIFDTQVLSIFRRRKEIGTLMALGMTRSSVIWLFTFEGAIHGILAALVAAIYGIPLLAYSAKHGIAMPEAVDDFGMTIAEKIFPVYSCELILTTSLIIMLVVTVVSYMPTRKILQLNPTEAIRGKIA